ncbi:MAG: tRNA (guanosine(37)-N1)-methyltransferase TrmD [Pseudomonadota bacterium]
MKVCVVTLFEGLVSAVTEHGVLSRAVERGLVSVDTVDPRAFATDVHRTVDDRPYGGGPGMVMRVEPLRTAIAHARRRVGGETPKTIYLGAAGKPLTHEIAARLACEPALVLVSGRYEGVDQRLLDAEVDEELSIGDYVLSGGELAAMVLIDAVVRLLPGALGNAESAVSDSFVDGLLDWPHYTRPEAVDFGDGEAVAVPEVLLGGNHAVIERWRRQQALGRTWERRPELLEGLMLSDEDRQLLSEYQAAKA